MSLSIPLPCGTLTLDVTRAEMPFEDLCGFASRRNRKRGFLFVSKMLGKHVPVRPSRMREIHERLARKLADVPGPAVLVAMAETATGLGQGVFECLLEQTGRDDVLFLHTTRYRLSRPPALTFDESHSHAVEHLLYEPADVGDLMLFRSARSLILVDDEISTGRTLGNLAQAYARLNRSLRLVVLASITNWLGGRRGEIAEHCGRDVATVELVQGKFDFVPNEDFDPGSIPDVTGRGDCKDGLLPARGGRYGLRRIESIDADRLLASADLASGQRVLVLGTGEFAHAPYRLALEIERRGWDVHYQSTTRSPILGGDAIGSVMEFEDNYHDGIPNYVYNVADRHYDRVLIGYETNPLPESHRLPEMLGARVLYF